MATHVVRTRALVAMSVLAFSISIAQREPGGAATSQVAAAPIPGPSFALTPKRILGLIRATFRSHRPPPPFVTYTIDREQNTEQGFHDYEGSYKEEIWLRSSDRAALSRRVLRGSYRGEPVFERPAFNSDRDPGPPTADIFEPAPAKPHPIAFVPTPEPTNSGEPLRVLTEVQTLIELDYDVESVTTQGEELDVKLTPLRDPMRNRLRELFVDKNTYELHRVIATDLLFVDSAETYGVNFTITFAQYKGMPIVTDIHGIVGDGYNGDGKVVDYHFTKTAFPDSLPDWYFDPGKYREHSADWPTTVEKPVSATPIPNT